MTTITASRYHDFSCGHRVVGHEGKCKYLHGHNYRVHFEVRAEWGSAPLDSIGRVVDFSAIKQFLAEWLETNWDHKFLAWHSDALMTRLSESEKEPLGVVWLPFNPTAENMAHYLLTVIGPAVLPQNVELIKVTVEETRKCQATASL